MLSSIARKWRRHRPPVAKRWPHRRPELEALEDRLVLSHFPNPLAPGELSANAGPVATFPVSPVAVASDADGDFVVAWTSAVGEGEFNVFARRFSRDGVALDASDILVTPDPIDDPLTGGRVTVDVAMDADGDFVVVYDAFVFDFSGSQVFGDRVFARAYGADGNPLGDAILVTPANDSRFDFTAEPSVAVSDAGTFVVAFRNAFNFSGFVQENLDVFVSGFRFDGTPLFGPVRVNTDESIRDSGPAIAGDGAGNFVVTWNAIFPQRESNFIAARRFDAGGNPLDGAPIVVEPNVFPGSRPAVGVGRSGGTFAIAWDENNDFVEAFIRARRFDAASGNPLPEFATNSVVNDRPMNFTFGPSVDVDSQEDFVIAWATGSSGTTASVFYRAFDVDGTQVNVGQVRVNVASADFGPNDVAVDDCGNFVVGWSGSQDEFVEGPVSQDIFARLFRVPDNECPPDQPPDEPPPPPELPPPPPPPDVPPPVADFDPATIIALVNATPVPTRSASDDAFILLESSPPTFAPAPVLPPPRPLSLEAFIALGTGRRDTLGEIGGLVFEDLNGNGVQDEGEPSLRGQLVFLDLNDNGVPDEDEPRMETDSQGRYLFGGLALTRHKVRQDLRPLRLRQTLPERNSAYVIELTPEQSSVPHKDFGVKVVPVSGGVEKRQPVTPERVSPKVRDTPPPPPDRKQDTEPQGGPAPDAPPEAPPEPPPS